MRFGSDGWGRVRAGPSPFPVVCHLKQKGRLIGPQVFSSGGDHAKLQQEPAISAPQQSIHGDDGST